MSDSSDVVVDGAQAADNTKSKGDDFSYSFTVTNTGGKSADNYTAYCIGTSGVDYTGPDSVTVNLDSGEDTTFQATGSFLWGASSVEYPGLEASLVGGSVSDRDSVEVTLGSDSVQVDFNAEPSAEWIGQGATDTLYFTVTNSDSVEIHCLGPGGQTGQGCAIAGGASELASGIHNVGVRVTNTSQTGQDSVWLAASVDFLEINAPSDSIFGTYGVYDPAPTVTYVSGSAPDSMAVGDSIQAEFVVSTTVPFDVDYDLTASSNVGTPSVSGPNPVTLNLTSNETDTVSVDLTATTANANGYVRLTASTSAGGGGSDLDTHNLEVTSGLTMQVVPVNEPITLAPSTVDTVEFTLDWGGTTREDFDLSLTCGGDLTSCEIKGAGGTTIQASVPNPDTVVHAVFTSGSATTAPDTLALTATKHDDGSVHATGSYVVTASATPTLTLTDANPG